MNQTFFGTCAFALKITIATLKEINPDAHLLLKPCFAKNGFLQ